MEAFRNVKYVTRNYERSKSDVLSQEAPLVLMKIFSNIQFQTGLHKKPLLSKFNVTILNKDPDSNFTLKHLL